VACARAMHAKDLPLRPSLGGAVDSCACLAGWEKPGTSGILERVDFYSDRTIGSVPRTGEEITHEVWQGLVALITRRIDDGSLAREFPQRRCPDVAEAITGTDEERFEIALNTVVPQLQRESAPVPEVKSPFSIYRAPSTPVALDVVEFVGRYIAEPSGRLNIRLHLHEHLSFENYSRHVGQEKFRAEVEQIFARNGLAFTIGEDMRVQRLGPAEARPLLSDFTPKTGDADLDAALRAAHTRFLSRDPQGQYDALKDLWDAFERLKTLELGGDKGASIRQLVDRAAPDSPFRDRLDAELKELTMIGNKFRIRHFEHDTAPLPAPPRAAVDYLFTRMLALIGYLLRQTGRM
jgi:hypothetical protein